MIWNVSKVRTKRLANGVIVMNVDQRVFGQLEASCNKSEKKCNQVDILKRNSAIYVPQHRMQHVEVIVFAELLDFWEKRT